MVFCEDIILKHPDELLGRTMSHLRAFLKLFTTCLCVRFGQRIGFLLDLSAKRTNVNATYFTVDLGTHSPAVQ